MGTYKMSLGDRMKRHERVPYGILTRRTPVIIRVDGKAFHTLTKGLNKPHDQAMVLSMTEAAIALMRELQGAQIAYIQSDEISILLTDYTNFSTEAWFDYEVQKMVSISAAIATAYFNEMWKKLLLNREEMLKLNGQMAVFDTSELHKWSKKAEQVALFDSRCFNVPREEVVNYFLWRQQDAIRNSIQGLAQANFSHKELHGLSCDQLQEKLWQEKQINWNDLEVWKKRGWCVTKKTVLNEGQDGTEPSYRTMIEPDWDIPDFGKDRSYIDQYVYPQEEEGK